MSDVIERAAIMRAERERADEEFRARLRPPQCVQQAACERGDECRQANECLDDDPCDWDDDESDRW